MDSCVTPLVSMITYCFNGERFLNKYFQALLAQTYTNIELFFYNNGSVDRTGEIAERYKPLLEEKGICVNLTHFKENQCTCALKNDGLQRSHGKYFFGVDCDDIMTPDHVECMVDFLERNPQFNIVFGKLDTIQEETGKQISVMQVLPKPQKELFIDCLMSRNMIYTPIGYMVRTEAFRVANNGMEIYVTRFGENYQVLLPLLFAGQTGFLDKVVGQYLVRSDSYTGSLRNPQKMIAALDAQIATVCETLKRMKIPEEEKFSKLAQKRLLRDSFLVAFYTKDRVLVRARWKTLKDSGGVNWKLRIKYLRFMLIKK